MKYLTELKQTLNLLYFILHACFSMNFLFCFFCYFFYFFYSKWDINRRHSFTTRRQSSLGLTSNMATKVIFGQILNSDKIFSLQVAFQLSFRTSYSVACSLFLQHLEDRNNNCVCKKKLFKKEWKNMKFIFHDFAFPFLHFTN